MDGTQLASVAQALKDNEAFQEALSALRSDALEGLARTPATDTEAIRDRQTTVKVVDELRGKIDAFIRNGQPRRPAGIV